MTGSIGLSGQGSVLEHTDRPTSSGGNGEAFRLHWTQGDSG